MKELLVAFLNERMHTEGRYQGGGDEQQILVVSDSELNSYEFQSMEEAKNIQVNNFADEIITFFNDNL